MCIINAGPTLNQHVNAYTHHVGLMLAQILHQYKTTLPQHIGSMEGHFAIIHCANIIFPMLGKQRVLHSADDAATYGNGRYVPPPPLSLSLPKCRSIALHENNAA